MSSKDFTHYQYKGNIYTYLQEIQMKHPVTGDWINAVLYSDPDGKTYCREFVDFFVKFNGVRVNSMPEWYEAFAKIREKYLTSHGLNSKQ